MSELDLYDYHLPDALIAREPATRRDEARLLVVDRASGQMEHRRVCDLPELLRAGDLLVLNDTRVLPARLMGYRAATGGRWEGLFLKAHQPDLWEVIGQTRGKLVVGEDLIVPAIGREGEAPAEPNPTARSASAGENRIRPSADSEQSLGQAQRERRPPGRAMVQPGSAGAAPTDSGQRTTDNGPGVGPLGVPGGTDAGHGVPRLLSDNRQLTTDNCLRLTLVERLEDGGWLMRPNLAGSHVELLGRYGQVPLPPYIERDTATEADRERYQTLHSRHPGSVAAPTAGLHFTPELLHACRERGINDAYVTLHVGLGTFRPISVDRLQDHVMHSEWCEVTAATVEQIQRTKAAGGRIVAVGTTSVRTLESASQSGQLLPYSGETRLFIRPPYTFHTVDAILTNFHLPKSTLLVLLSAFVGRERLLEVYSAAIAERYRFYSYGDGMLTL